MNTTTDQNVNRAELAQKLLRAGYMMAADDVTHGKHQGNLTATLGEIADHHEDAGLPEAAGIIRRAVEQAKRDADRERDEAINDQASAAARVIRDAAAFGSGPDQLETLVGKLDAMASRADDEMGLDAADALTWHLRQLLYNESATVDHMQRLTAEHLAARDDCPSCGGDNCVGGTGRGTVESENVECPRCGPSGKVGRYPHQLGDVLRDWCEELAGVGGLAIMVQPKAGDGSRLVPDDGGGLELPELASVMVQAALPWIDWRGLAVDLIRDYIAEHGDDRPEWARS